MADDRDNSTDGGTAGTGEAEALPERATQSPEQGQGDDLADSLGGGETGGAGATGAGSASGDASATRSEGGGGTGLGGIDAGSPGGMGGVHARGGTGTGRPPGGVSPVEPSNDED
jgi:hypothetical protein